MTGVALPGACHICPFAVYGAAYKLTAEREILSLTVPQLFGDTAGQVRMLKSLLCPPGENAEGRPHGDKSWNMVTLHLQGHKYWTMACLGLRPVDGSRVEAKTGSSPDPEFTSVVVEWRWLSDQIPEALGNCLITAAGSKGHAGRVVGFESQSPANMARAIHGVLNDPRAVSTVPKMTLVDSETGRRVESGH